MRSVVCGPDISDVRDQTRERATEVHHPERLPGGLDAGRACLDSFLCSGSEQAGALRACAFSARAASVLGILFSMTYW